MRHWPYERARFYEPATGRFNRLDPFFGNLQDPLSLHKYLYVHGDPVNGIDPTGEWSMSLSGLLAGISIVSTAAAIYIPAIGTGLERGRRIAADGQQTSLFASIFQGTVTRQDFVRAFDGFVDGGTAGLANVLDTLTFRQIKTINDWQLSRWDRADLHDSWLGAASNTAAWVGTVSGYAAAAVWAWGAAGRGTMSVSLEKGGSPWFLHVRYGANGLWEHAALGTGRSGLGGMNIYRSLTPTSGLQITGIPTLFPQNVLLGSATTKTAFSCITAALRAWIRGLGI